MIVYIVMTDEKYNHEVDKVFINEKAAEKYKEGKDTHWIEEHEVMI